MRYARGQDLPMAGVHILAVFLKHLLVQHGVSAQTLWQTGQSGQQVAQGDPARGVRQIVLGAGRAPGNRAAGAQIDDGISHSKKILAKK